jgi:hypothetical protein
MIVVKRLAELLLSIPNCVNPISNESHQLEMKKSISHESYQSFFSAKYSTELLNVVLLDRHLFFDARVYAD